MADYTTVEAFKDYRGKGTSGDDDLIGDLITAASRWMDREARRTLYSDADATRYYDVDEDTDGDVLYLDHEISAITSVTTDADGSSPVNLTTGTEYVTIPRNDPPYDRIRIKDSSENSWTYTDDSADGIEVVGRWSYFSSLVGDLQHNCNLLVNFAYTQKDSAVFDTVAIPDAGVIQVPQGFPVSVARWLQSVRLP